mgnify:CR=1 FL=1
MDHKITVDEVVARSVKIRERYHELERINHHAEWTVQEDALAFLSEKADLLLKVKSKLERERPQNTHAAPSSNTKTYVSTKRVCK